MTLALAAALLAALVGANSAIATGKIAAAWYAGWHGLELPLAHFAWDKYTHVTYSFAETMPDGTLSLETSQPELLPRFVKRAKEHGVKALVSIGGWGGSQYFSSAVATKENRTAFVRTVLDFAERYNLDGIDFDWEYPGSQGIGCNDLSSNDTSNYLSFLQELRATPPGRALILTAATPLLPWVESDGNHSSDVSAFADVFDYVALMNYDVWGSWSPAVGPNAPLADSCAPKSYQQGSAATSVKAWATAGMPESKIVLGVPGYGRAFSVNASSAFNGSNSLSLYPAFNASARPMGDSWDVASSIDQCGNKAGPSGVWNFWGMVRGGWLTTNGSVADGIDYIYDECSQTSYVYNRTAEVMIAFDNARSFRVKGQYIKESRLAGFAMWEAAGDYDDILLDSIRAAAGIA